MAGVGGEPPWYLDIPPACFMCAGETAISMVGTLHVVFSGLEWTMGVYLSSICVTTTTCGPVSHGYDEVCVSSSAVDVLLNESEGPCAHPLVVRLGSAASCARNCGSHACDQIEHAATEK